VATNKKITELTELVGVDLADDDVIPIVDISAGTTHKIQKSTLAAAVSGVATLAATSPIAVDTATGDVTVSTGTIPVASGGTGATTASAAATALGVGTGDSPQFTAVNIGAATDTTVARSGAGDITVEGNAIYRAGGTDVPVTDGGTGASSASAAATALGVGTGDSPQFTAVNVGAASDTTLARSGAGDLTVEGNALYRAGGTDVPVADGGTGRSTLTANYALLGDGTSALQMIAPSTSGNVLTSNGSTWASTASGAAALGFKNVSSWLDDAVETVTLDTDASAIGKADVTVWEEVPDTGKTNAVWDIVTDDLGFDLIDSAYAVTLTPAATTGSSIEFTLGSGSWSASDIGKRIVNVASGEAGKAAIISIASGVATCVINTTFTDTNAIASGDWELYSGEFVSGDFALSNATVSGGTDLSSGSETVFESASSTYTEVTALSETKALVVYIDVGNGNYGTACVLNISGSTVSIGTPTVFKSALIQFPDIVKLTSTTAIVCYTVGTSSGASVVLSVSGDTISVGTEVEYESGQATFTRVVLLEAGKAFVVYRDQGNSHYATACVLDVSGTTITAGSPYVFHSVNSELFGVAACSSTKVVVGYRNGSSGDSGWATGLTISGTTIGSGTPVQFETGSTDYVSGTPLTSTTALFTYSDGGDFSAGTAVVLTLDVVTVIVGTLFVFSTNSSRYHSVVALSATSAVDVYRDSSNYDYGTAVLLAISGTTITAETPVVFKTTESNFCDIAKLSSTKTIVTYSDNGNSDYGTAEIVSLEQPLYVSSQYVTTISGSDSVDTTFYSDWNSTAITQTLNGEEAFYAFSVDSTPSAAEITGGTFKIVGGSQTTLRSIASSLSSVHGGTAGVWYTNTNVTYGSATWAASATNEAKAAIQIATAVAANQMDGTAFAAISDANLPAFGTQLSIAITLRTTDATVTPTVDSISFNYDADVINRDETDNYIIEMPAVGTIKATAPSSGTSRNARIYVTS